MQETEPVTRPPSVIAEDGHNIRSSREHRQPRRTAPFSQQPGFYEPAGLWLYGNVRLFQSTLGYVACSLGAMNPANALLEEIETDAEKLVLDGKALVCGIHNEVQRRVAVVPLRWGSPRIIVMSGGFKYHLGEDLDQEPFRAARLWRYQWDARTDLAVSRRAPDKKATFANHNPTIDRLIEALATCQWPGLRFPVDSLTALTIPTC